ncbi:hypothetical protein BFJ68_g9128 [Fusarium oxysporum]|uniref:Uncharacterized protein n=1 Tax=Fusarium oxysporum TaxID=5507 RepID=A0A420QWU0_FUSOX|nr:hypothetical protein BFJ68_g9128 [Fusarium oxysporum]
MPDVAGNSGMSPNISDNFSDAKYPEMFSIIGLIRIAIRVT